jgi:hypothetical protein
MLQALEELKRIGHVATSHDAQQFEQALQMVLSFRDPDCISALLLLLDDNAVFHELMFAIIHGVESFGIDQYLPHLLSCLLELHRTSPFWTGVLHYRILNSPNVLNAYISCIKTSNPAIRQTAKDIFAHIGDSKDRFREQCAALLMQID